jgi:hypothetical protein
LPPDRRASQRFEHIEGGILDAIAKRELVAPREFLNGRQKPQQKLITRFDRRARAPRIARHFGSQKNSNRASPWTQEVKS